MAHYFSVESSFCAKVACRLLLLGTKDTATHWFALVQGA